MTDSGNESLFQQVAGMLSAAERRVVVVSAFVRSETLGPLLLRVSPNVQIDLYARWRIADLVAGASDAGVFCVAQSNNARFRVHSALHAKIYIADDNALIGSANATDSGLGRPGGKSGNLEILIKCPANCPEVRAVLEQLKAQSVAPRKFDDELIRRMREAKLPPPNENGGAGGDNWLPYSLPEYLIKLGATGEFAADGVLQDCYALAITPGATAEQIGRVVAGRRIFAALWDNLIGGYKDAVSDEMGRSILANEFFVNAGDAPQKWELLKKWVDAFSKQMYVSSSKGGGYEIRRGQRLSSEEL